MLKRYVKETYFHLFSSIDTSYYWRENSTDEAITIMRISRKTQPLPARVKGTHGRKATLGTKRTRHIHICRINLITILHSHSRKNKGPIFPAKNENQIEKFDTGINSTFQYYKIIKPKTIFTTAVHGYWKID